MAIKNKARSLRKSMTDAEEVLWEKLRNHRFHGLQFRRQYPVSQRYILDFYCAKIRLGIEIDGKIHEGKHMKRNDTLRTESLNAKGIRILRFSNSEVVEKLQLVLEKIFSQFPPSPRQPLAKRPPAYWWGGGEGVG